MPMDDPSHPGEIVQHLYLDNMDMTVQEAADLLDMDIRELTTIIECREPVSLNVARRLSLVFGSTTDMWLRLQVGYDNAPIRNVGMGTQPN